MHEGSTPFRGFQVRILLSAGHLDIQDFTPGSVKLLMYRIDYGMRCFGPLEFISLHFHQSECVLLLDSIGGDQRIAIDFRETRRQTRRQVLEAFPRTSTDLHGPPRTYTDLH